MTDLEILFWTVQLLALMWIVYKVGYYTGRVDGVNSAMGFIDGELKRLKKILEDCTTEKT
jgi:hypothetical protein